VNKDLIDLREKYVRLRELRASKADRPPTKAELRAVADRWPGALAEIDRLADSTLLDRIAALDAAIAGGDTPLWARAWVLAHRRLRGALAIKAKLAGLRSEGELPEESGLYASRVEEIRRPPNGKLTDLVFADVARDLGLPAETMRALLLPRDVVH